VENKNMKKRFVLLYEKESDAVFRYCIIRTSSREIALDISQESFMRFWDSLIKGKDITNDRAFIFTIAKNLIIDWYRKKKSVSLESMGESFEGEDQDVLDRLIIGDDGQEKEEFNAEGRYIIEKIKELDEPYQQVMYLRFVEDMKPKEIAEILEQPVNVVSVRIFRALEKMREIMNIKI